jgi:hypothetical protein
LNTIEHPVYDYEKIVVLVASSEGVSRREIGRHFWAELRPMWNMPKEGFRQLYEKTAGTEAPLRGRVAVDWRKPEDAREALRVWVGCGEVVAPAIAGEGVDYGVR